jgi:hypothetical protein
MNESIIQNSGEKSKEFGKNVQGRMKIIWQGI